MPFEISKIPPVTLLDAAIVAAFTVLPDLTMYNNAPTSADYVKWLVTYLVAFGVVLRNLNKTPPAGKG